MEINEILKNIHIIENANPNEESDIEKFSFSKLSNFETCKMQYFINYITGEKGEDGVYGYLGGVFHSILEDLQNKKISIREAKIRFNQEFNFSQMMGMKFPTEKSGKNYFENLMLYLDNYKAIECDSFKTEDYFEMIIHDIIIRGYIDLYYIIGNDIFVIDYKTSSKFSKKDLESKGNQLILYGIYLKKKYPKKNIYLYFDMCKYSMTKRNSLKERNKNTLRDNAYVEIKFDEENIKKTINFVVDSYNKIKECNSFDKNINKFFCENICGVKGECDAIR